MEFPSLRFGVTGHRSQDVGPRTPPARRGHFLDDDLGAFDASFFGISAKEAETMDPQQRLILEEVYHALENAGLPMQMIAGSDTSVFVSSSSSDYAMMQCKDPLQMPKHLAMGMINSMMASRVSTIFDFHGPCVTVDTALSSGLASVELACQSIWTGDAAMVSLLPHPNN